MEFFYIIFSSNATGEPFYNDVRVSQLLWCVPSFDCLYSLLGQKNMYLYKGYEYKVVVNWAGFCPTLTVYLGHTNTPHPLYFSILPTEPLASFFHYGLWLSRAKVSASNVDRAIHSFLLYNVAYSVQYSKFLWHIGTAVMVVVSLWDFWIFRLLISWRCGQNGGRKDAAASPAWCRPEGCRWWAGAAQAGHATAYRPPSGI